VINAAVYRRIIVMTQPPSNLLRELINREFDHREFSKLGDTITLASRIDRSMTHAWNFGVDRTSTSNPPDRACHPNFSLKKNRTVKCRNFRVGILRNGASRRTLSFWYDFCRGQESWFRERNSNSNWKSAPQICGFLIELV